MDDAQPEVGLVGEAGAAGIDDDQAGAALERVDGGGGVGDPRKASAELGKRVFDMKVKYGIEEIRRLMGARR